MDKYLHEGEEIRGDKQDEYIYIHIHNMNK